MSARLSILSVTLPWLLATGAGAQDSAGTNNVAGTERSPAAAAAPTAAETSRAALTARIDDTRYFSGGQGTEPTQAIAAAFFTVDTPPGPGVPATPLAPVDGSFNTSAENVTGTLDPAGLTPGRHLVYVYGQDTTGQNGVPTAIFLEVLDTGLLFADGFESGTIAAWI